MTVTVKLLCGHSATVSAAHLASMKAGEAGNVAVNAQWACPECGLAAVNAIVSVEPTIILAETVKRGDGRKARVEFDTTAGVWRAYIFDRRPVGFTQYRRHYADAKSTILSLSIEALGLGE